MAKIIKGSSGAEYINEKDKNGYDKLVGEKSYSKEQREGRE